MGVGNSEGRWDGENKGWDEGRDEGSGRDKNNE